MDLPGTTPVTRAQPAIGERVAAVLGAYLARRSVVLATLAGALAHGLAVWALGPALP